MAIIYDPTKVVGRLASKRKIKRMMKKGNLSLKRAALSMISDVEYIDKTKVLDVALKTVNAYEERIEKIESGFDADKFNISPDDAKQYGYKAKSSGLTSLSKKMPDGPDTALVEYTENRYKRINAELRTGKVSSEIKDYVKDIDNAMDISVLKEKTTLYRGVVVSDDFDPSNLKAGDSFKDKSFASTSPSKGIAKSFSKSIGKKGVLFEIELEAGQKAVDLTQLKAGVVKGEKEILLPRDTEFEVISSRNEDGVKVIKLRPKDQTERIKEAEAKAEEIKKNPKQLIQRVQNEIIFQVKERIKEKYDGEKYEWLPSDADEPDPEHQLLYGTIRTVGVGEMPGDRYGCKCGMRILTDEEKLNLD